VLFTCVPFFQSLDIELPALGDRLFPRLLPKVVREAMTAFGQQASELINAASQEAKEVSKQARLQLAAVGLPGSLEVRVNPVVLGWVLVAIGLKGLLVGPCITMCSHMIVPLGCQNRLGRRSKI